MPKFTESLMGRTIYGHRFFFHLIDNLAVKVRIVIVSKQLRYVHMLYAGSGPLTVGIEKKRMILWVWAEPAAKTWVQIDSQM